MEEFIVKAKAHQIFLSFLTPSIIAGLIPDVNANVVLIKQIFIALPYVIWIFLLGRSLNQCIPTRYRLNDSFLIVMLFTFIIIYVPIVMVMDLSISFYGWAVLIPLLLIISFLYLFYFASKALTSAEKGKRTSFWDHIGEMILLLLGYIGIWFIQPRINKIYWQNREVFMD